MRRQPLHWTPMLEARLTALVTWVGIRDAARILRIDEAIARERCDRLGVVERHAPTPITSRLRATPREDS